MKAIKNFVGYFILMLLIQMVICNYLEFSPLVVISILPVMILCLPTDLSPIPTMLIAFASGLLVDLLGDGVLGLNALSLVPVAFIRRGMMKSIFDSETIERGTGISIRKNGLVSILMCIIFVETVFMIVYIIADGAGTRGLLFNLLRFACSLAASSIVGLACTHILTTEDRR